MNKGIVIATIILALLIIAPIAYYLISPLFIVVEMNEDLPLGEKSISEISKESILLRGNFVPSAHEATGDAILIEGNGKKILRFEDFEVLNGPDLHVWLVPDLNFPEDDYIDLGRLKATKGNINYEISEEIDFEKYDKVIIWCVPFKVLFGYADLNQKSL